MCILLVGEEKIEEGEESEGGDDRIRGRNGRERNRWSRKGR